MFAKVLDQLSLPGCTEFATPLESAHIPGSETKHCIVDRPLGSLV